jgi:hypothetical protein
MITVQHKTAWCAAKHKKTIDYQDSVETMCGHFVILPWGISSARPPTCPECLRALAHRNHKPESNR